VFIPHPQTNISLPKMLSKLDLLKTLKSSFKTFKDYIEGNFAYENYLKHHTQHHQNTTPLTKKAFLKQAQKDKWSKINRCC